MEFSPTTRVYFHLLSVTSFHVQKMKLVSPLLRCLVGKALLLHSIPGSFLIIIGTVTRRSHTLFRSATQVLTVNVESSKRGRLNNLTDTIPSVTKYPDWLFHIIMMKWQFYNFAACERQVLWSLTVKEIAKVQESHVGGTMGRSLLIEPSHLFLLLFFDLDP